MVKILDFGLAKALNEGAAGESASTRDRTHAGAIFGTAAYMSPDWFNELRALLPR